MVNNEKEITFIRHAESLGNLVGKKPWRYAYEAGSNALTAWKDGRLSDHGKRYSQKRVKEEFNDELVDRILNADVVYVSPLVRAMETCIIVLSAAAKRKGLNRRPFEGMNFVVTSDLREKLGSESDKPGASGVDVGEYLQGVADEQAKTHGGTKSTRDGYSQMVGKIIASYKKEVERTQSFADDPDNAEKILQSIDRFRATLGELPGSKKRVLIIGHNGWSRWNFAAGLNSLCALKPWSDIAFGGRDVGELQNLGVVTAKFNRGKFYAANVFGANGKCAKKGKFGVFSSLDEAKDANLIPGDAVIHHMLAQKKMDNGGYRVRWLTFSASNGHSFLAWANDFAEPKKYIDLVKTVGVRYACDVENNVLLLDVVDGKVPVWSEQNQHDETVRPFQIKAKEEDDKNDFNRLCLLLTVHIKFGSDAKFIGKIFEEIGWKGYNIGEAPTNDKEKMKKWEAQWTKQHPDVPLVLEAQDEDLEMLRKATDQPNVLRDSIVDWSPEWAQHSP